jgi:hypothetical protein
MLKYFTILACSIEVLVGTARPSLQHEINKRDGWSNNYSFHNVKKALCNSEENKEKKYAIARF